jgi:hypothetical protein
MAMKLQVPMEEVMSLSRLALLSAPLLLIAALGLATAQSRKTESTNVTADQLDPRCAGFDARASGIVAMLGQDHDAIAAVKLRDAQFRLRRPRKNCYYGFVSVAIQDYAALIEGRYLGYRMQRDVGAEFIYSVSK